jgi:DNA replication and repair protein RecF
VTLQRLSLTSLRCIEAAEITLNPSATFIFGPNGAGKTSILESIFVLSRGRSFRARQLRRLVRHGLESFTVFAELVDPNHRIGVALQHGRLEKRIDGRPAPGMAELAALLPAYSIEPGLHALLEGGPSDRRRFLDWGVFHVEHNYLALWRRYRRLLSQRNATLKTGPRGAELRPWTEALAVAGMLVDEQRSRYVEVLTPLIARYGEALLSESLSITYRRGWASEEDFAAALERHDRRDREVGATSVGPHRADLEVCITGRAVNLGASRGQQKLAVAAMVLAQVTAHQGHANGRAVLLVDDPAAELDAGSLARLTDCLARVDAQLVITALTGLGLDTGSGRVFHVERGKVRAL